MASHVATEYILRSRDKDFIKKMFGIFIIYVLLAGIHIKIMMFVRMVSLIVELHLLKCIYCATTRTNIPRRMCVRIRIELLIRVRLNKYTN